MAAWLQVEFAQEAGDAPLLRLSDGPSLLAPLSQTPAAQAFLEQRADISTPLVLSGGLGLGWLNLLFWGAENRLVNRALILYSGGDDACSMASHAIAGAVSPLRAAPGQTPEGLVEFLIPEARPGANGSWDTLPMWALSDEQGWSLAPGWSSHINLQAWLTGGLIFFLIAVSLLAGVLLNVTPGG